MTHGEVIADANLQIDRDIGRSTRLAFRHGSRDMTVLMDVDGAPKALATLRLSTLRTLTLGGEVAGAVLAICNARQRALRTD